MACETDPGNGDYRGWSQKCEGDADETKIKSPNSAVPRRSMFHFVVFAFPASNFSVFVHSHSSRPGSDPGSQLVFIKEAL